MYGMVEGHLCLLLISPHVCFIWFHWYAPCWLTPFIYYQWKSPWKTFVFTQPGALCLWLENCDKVVMYLAVLHLCKINLVILKRTKTLKTQQHPLFTILFGLYWCVAPIFNGMLAWRIKNKRKENINDHFSSTFFCVRPVITPTWKIYSHHLNLKCSKATTDKRNKKEDGLLIIILPTWKWWHEHV